MSIRTGRPTIALVPTEAERRHLESPARRSRTAPQLARRARLVLACAAGHNNKTVARRLRLSPAIVGKVARALRVGPALRVAAAIREFIAAHNADAKPCVWTKTTDEILASIGSL